MAAEAVCANDAVAVLAFCLQRICVFDAAVRRQQADLAIQLVKEQNGGVRLSHFLERAGADHYHSLAVQCDVKVPLGIRRSDRKFFPLLNHVIFPPICIDERIIHSTVASSVRSVLLFAETRRRLTGAVFERGCGRYRRSICAVCDAEETELRGVARVSAEESSKPAELESFSRLVSTVFGRKIGVLKMAF